MILRKIFKRFSKKKFSNEDYRTYYENWKENCFLKAYDYSSYNWETSVTLDTSISQCLCFPVMSQEEESKITSYFKILFFMGNAPGNLRPAQHSSAQSESEMPKNCIENCKCKTTVFLNQ